MFQGILVALTILWALPVQAMNLQLSQDDEEEIGEVAANHKFLFAAGIIEMSDAIKIKALLNRQYYNGRRTVILLSSPGGVLEAVEDLKKTILRASDDYFEKYKEKMVVITNLECSSACNILLAALSQGAESNHLEIHVASSAKLGFHSPVDFVKKKTKAIKDERVLTAKREKMLKAYKSYGVSSAWLNSRHAIFQKSEMTYISGEKLCSEKSGVISHDACFDDSGNRDIFAEVSANLEQKKPLFQKP